METGTRGAFVVSWGQAELDGIAAADPTLMNVGSLWRWSGQPIRIDFRRDVFLLEDAEGLADLHRKAAGQIGRILGAWLTGYRHTRMDAGAYADVQEEDDGPLFRSGFELTDGRETYHATLIALENSHHPMVLFEGSLPPAGRDLWVVSCSVGADLAAPVREASAMVCFVPGTRISTPDGPRPVEDLAEDDLILTKDSGPQPVRWVGDRRISGARLVAQPQLRPVRLASGAFAKGEPDEDLLVSPDHRILLQGPAAMALFNTPEVLVAARDLINDHSVRPCRSCTSVRYIHIMLDQHQIIWANGLEVESFHPAGVRAEQIVPHQRNALFERFPDLRYDLLRYGDYARRALSRPEAAIFSHAVTGGH